MQHFYVKYNSGHCDCQIYIHLRMLIIEPTSRKYSRYCNKMTSYEKSIELVIPDMRANQVVNLLFQY